MGFASSWLEERALYPQLIEEAPSPDTGIITVIPAFNEPEITILLDSLFQCSRPECGTEVIIIINAPVGTDEQILLNNSRSLTEIEAWKKLHPDAFFRVFAIDITSGISGDWGVGMARKTGMDEAVRRFSSLNRPDGIILCLDADCKVKSNYFESVCHEMYNIRDRNACSIYFEHPVSGDEFSEDIYHSIILYELHLRYYLQALAFTGFPYVHHTIGSSMAVKALPYIRSGGMNRRSAGEDFYFIQKLVPAGGYFNLNSTAVYPSPRTSSRVPFGTGAAVSKLTGDDSSFLLTYNLQAFRELKIMFGMIDNIFTSGAPGNKFLYDNLPEGMVKTMESADWSERIEEVMRNTSGIASFRKRFFNWFNMFRIVKYLNSVHKEVFEKVPVQDCASQLIAESGVFMSPGSPLLLLEYFRKLERGDQLF